MNSQPPFSDFLKLDFSQLEAGPVQYFLLHSGVFIGVLAGVCFILGLWFGALTWGRHKKHKKALLAENTQLKQEIASLKRRVAEAAVKPAPTEPEPAPAPESTPPTPPAATAELIPEPTPPPAPPPVEEKPGPEPAPEPAADDSVLPPLPIPDTPAAAPEPPPPTAPKPAPVAATPVKNLVKAKTKSKAEDIEPMPFLLGPIGKDDEADASNGKQTPSDTPPAAEPEPVTGSSPTSTPPPSVLSALATPPPPPASWKNTRKIKLPPGVAPTNAVVDAPPSPEPGEDEAPPRKVLPQSDEALGSIFLERPNDEDIDDLKQIKGVSSILEGQLNQFGVYTFEQIAAWTHEHVREFSTRLAFKDRIEREKWVEQAKDLAK